MGFQICIWDRSVVDRVSISLAVSDDAPREDFSPRQRHTLKEFAVRILFIAVLCDGLIAL